MTWIDKAWNWIKSAVSSVTGSLLGTNLTDAQREANSFSSNEALLQREWSSQEAERARDWNEEMYAKYNSLSGKIAQAEEAGVNPMLAVTGSAVSPMTTGASAPSGSSASSVSPSGNALTDMIGQIMGIMKLKSEIENIKADTDQKRSSADYTSWLSKLSERSYKIITENNFDIRKLEADIGLTTDQANLAFQEAGKVFEEAGKIAEEKRFLVDTANDRQKIVEYERLIKEFESSISSSLEVLDGDKKAELSDIVGAILKAILAFK